MATFNGLDYAIFVLLFLSVAIGVARGFVKEVISLIAWVAAFVIATLYSIKLASLFPSAAEHAAGANPIESVSLIAIGISYLLLFFGILICGSIVKLIVNSMVEGGGLSLLNRLLGAIFGLARGCFIVMIALFFLTFTALVTHALWKDSKMVGVFNPGVKWLSHLSQPYLAQIEAKMKKTAKNLNQEDLSDVIKTKPSNPGPVETAPVMSAPSTAAPATLAPPAASMPAVVSTPPAAVSTPPVVSTPKEAPATPQTVPQKP